MNDRNPSEPLAPSRRSFLRRSRTTAALSVPATIAATSSLSHGASAKKLTGLSATLINEILEDEAQHVFIIQNLLDDPDNPLPVPAGQGEHVAGGLSGHGQGPADGKSQTGRGRDT